MKSAEIPLFAALRVKTKEGGRQELRARRDRLEAVFFNIVTVQVLGESVDVGQVRMLEHEGDEKTRLMLISPCRKQIGRRLLHISSNLGDAGRYRREVYFAEPDNEGSLSDAALTMMDYPVGTSQADVLASHIDAIRYNCPDPMSARDLPRTYEGLVRVAPDWESA